MTRHANEQAAIASILLALVIITGGICALLSNEFFVAGCAAVTSIGLSFASAGFRARAETQYEQERQYGMWIRRPL